MRSVDEIRDMMKDHDIHLRIELGDPCYVKLMARGVAIVTINAADDTESETDEAFFSGIMAELGITRDEMEAFNEWFEASKPF